MINLLPNNIKESRIYGRRNLSLLGYSVALLATAVMTGLIIVFSLQFIGAEEPTLRQKIKDDEVKIQALESQIKSIEDIANRLETASKISDQSVNFSQLIPEIGAVLPEGVILNALSLTGGATDPLQLDVDLVDAGLAAVLIRNLVDSDLFEAADISSLSPKGSEESEEGGAPTYKFTASVSASFTGTAEAVKKAEAQAKKAEAEAKKAAEQASQR